MDRSRPRNPATLCDSFQKRLNMYAIAAGVGILALPESAEAKIIYTPAHAAITQNHAVTIDLTHDGKNDFTFQETFITTTSVGENHSIILAVSPARKGNEIWGMAHHASALEVGVRIGPQHRFAYGKKLMAVDLYADGTGGSGTCGGPWNNVKNRYLGFKFSIQGATHFGWARLNVTCTTTFESHSVTGLLTGYAYETIPDKGIVAGQTKGTDEVPEGPDAAFTMPSPEPVSLGALALGAPGLSIWRREEESIGL